jgi:hypothetical protein
MNAAPSDPDFVLLVQTLENCGIEIRIEKCDGEGGLVRIQDRHVLFLPIHSPIEHKKKVCLDAIRKIMHGTMHIAPRIRKLLGEEEWDE